VHAADAVILKGSLGLLLRLAKGRSADAKLPCWTLIRPIVLLITRRDPDPDQWWYVDPGASDLGVYHGSALPGRVRSCLRPSWATPCRCGVSGRCQERAFTFRISASHGEIRCRPCFAAVGPGGMGALIGPRGRRGANHPDQTERPSSVGGAMSDQQRTVRSQSSGLWRL
jgi:hypothetical protein